MAKLVKGIVRPLRPSWLTLSRYRFLEEENALLMEQRGALRDELRFLHEENATLREANRQKQELIKYMLNARKGKEKIHAN